MRLFFKGKLGVRSWRKADEAPAKPAAKKAAAGGAPENPLKANLLKAVGKSKA